MAANAKHKKIDELMEKASDSVRRSAWFEAERIALKALLMARQEQDFERMGSIAGSLWQARRKRFQQALHSRKVIIVEGPVTEDMKIHKGCYLIQPPLVGADSRRLRLAALHQEVPVAVLCREPVTALKQVPVVAIGPGSTIRTKISPPHNSKSPDHGWFVTALEQLGDWAVESLDSELTTLRRVDALVDRLDALPEHEGLHKALEDACRQAHDEREASAAGAELKAANTKVNS